MHDTSTLVRCAASDVAHMSAFGSASAPRRLCVRLRVGSAFGSASALRSAPRRLCVRLRVVVEPGPRAPRAASGAGSPSARRLCVEGAQPRREILLKELQESTLIVPGRVEDEVVEAGIRVLLYLGDHLVRVGTHDEA